MNIKYILSLLLATHLFSNCGVDDDLDNKTTTIGCVSVFCISLDSSEADANGTTIIKIDGEVPKNADKDKRTFNFTTTAGVFTESGQSTFTVTANELGKSLAHLKVGTVPGDFYLKCSVGASPNVYDTTILISLKPVDIDQALEINFTNLNSSPLRADGISQVLMEAKAKGINYAGKKLSISVNGGGGFPTNNNANSFEADFDAGGNAKAILQVGQEVGDYIATFQLKDLNLSTNRTISLQRANPNTIELDPASFTIAQFNGSVSLTAYLGRGNGKVSNKSNVSFIATQAGGTVGSFSPPISLSTLEEVAQVTFKTPPVGTILTTEPIVVKACVLDDSGTEKCDSISLTVQ